MIRSVSMSSPRTTTAVPVTAVIGPKGKGVAMGAAARDRAG